MSSLDILTRLQLEAERRRGNAVELEESLHRFFIEAWPEIDPAEYVDGWHIQAMAAHLEAVACGDIQRLVINVHPRACKSLLTSVAFPAWIWAQQPQHEFPLLGPQVKFFCLSFSGELALDHATLHRRLVHSDWYRQRWGRRVQITSDQDNKGKFDTTAGGTRISNSFGGSVTGRGGDIKIIDDPHKMDEVESDNLRKEVLNKYNQVVRSRFTDARRAAEILVCQRGHESDLSNMFIDEGAEQLILPAEYDPMRMVVPTSLGWTDPRELEGELLWPERFTVESLAPYKRHPYEWASQWQQMPRARGGHIIDPDWWKTWDAASIRDYAHAADDIVWDERPVAGDPDYEDCGCPGLEKGCMRKGCPRQPPRRDYPRMSLLIASLDTAYTEKQDRDRSALTIWGVWRDKDDVQRLMLVYAWAGRLAIHDLTKLVAETCRKYRVHRLLVETQAAGISVTQELRRLYGREQWAVELVPAGRLDKSARAHSVVHLFTEGLVWAPDTYWARDVIQECASLPRGEHDDRADSAIMALRWLRDKGIILRPEEALAEMNDRARHRKPPEPLYPSFG